jgi:hypothetical protein
MLAAMRRWLVGVTLVVLVAGCGGGSSSNGEAGKSAQQVVADARQAADSAKIVHVVGGGVDNSRPLKLDLWIGDGKGKGHLEESGLAFDIVRIGDTVYLKAKSSFWKRFGGSAAAALLHDKWVKAPASTGDLASITPLTDKKQFFKSILEQHGNIENKGETTYKGQKVVEIRDTTQGGSLYVAAEGTPYPVAVEGGKQQGDVSFRDWNADEPVTAPKGAIDLSALGK